MKDDHDKWAEEYDNLLFQRLCYEAGVKTSDFWNSCISDLIAATDGYKQKKVFSLQQTRLIIYTIACTVTDPEKRGEVLDVFPIPGDPTPEERRQALENELQEAKKRQEEFNEELRKENKMRAAMALKQ